MIFFASDHAGFELKNILVEYLKSKNMEVEDCGPLLFDKNDDYPDLIFPCAQKVAADISHRGIILGWSGQGEAVVANKAKGIRTTVYYGGNIGIIKLGRQHNNANVLSLGAGFISSDEAKQAVDLWLATEFEGGRHQRRIDKIDKIEK
ncbi:MAG: ribose-5-phosphate isomerase [Candidatus Doudnabacteria bacterium CG10_big_fil_rev_8_21_14_0_10_42_18]|uniref:Ribose-5-phosphate isomerase n=1 Tax=Candidatus Doudnabacteria bacterium CG10_big_fil_rev_8_21_14_0_10_42_18 TaxID=1974552 RepID=A0A2H0VDV6_9BACT|nr:MAG: ribose-5-phosphate isomerase [Candidatus Doudnabacteria bacterium CG10_big_fil_rev_8_21_14_0_10_42_18]